MVGRLTGSLLGVRKPAACGAAVGVAVEMFESLLHNPVAGGFIIIVLGVLLGRAKVLGVSLGSSGVLFVALAFGHFRWVSADGLDVLGQFGVVLFVYSIGLQAGPRFVQTVRGKGTVPLIVAGSTVVGGAAVAGLVGSLLYVEPDLAVGVFAGALTSTPALAAATEASDNPLVSVSYGLAYPVGVIAVVLFGQLLPRWASHWRQRDDQRPDAPAAEPVHQRCYLVQNPGCIGKRITELRLHDLVSVNISRIFRGEEVLPFREDLALRAGDVVLAVGTGTELDRLALLIGPPVPAEVEMRNVPNVLARDVYISESGFSGRTLRHLHVRSKYNVVLTRVRREGVEFVPRGDFVLEIGDLVRAVGYEPDIRSFIHAAGIHEQRIHETGIPQFAFGLVLGFVLGFLPLPLPGLGSVKLGLAGGPLFVGLLLGHFGRIGRLRVHVPIAARYLMRELGLVLFLASAGVAAGAELVPTLQAQGPALAILAVVTVLAAVAIGFGLAYVLCRESLPSAMGMTCGAMTSTPGLGAVAGQFESDSPALSYAAAYPLALIGMTVTAQLLLTILG